MKYIRTFESINSSLQVGDWVIASLTSQRAPFTTYPNDPQLIDFLNSTPGQITTIVRKNEEYIKVRYDNIPDIINDRFTNNLRTCVDEQIVLHAKTKEELELKLASNKYNL